jgi:hypothetical protein
MAGEVFLAQGIEKVRVRTADVGEDFIGIEGAEMFYNLRGCLFFLEGELWVCVEVLV